MHSHIQILKVYIPYFTQLYISVSMLTFLYKNINLIDFLKFVRYVSSCAGA